MCSPVYPSPVKLICLNCPACFFAGMPVFSMNCCAVSVPVCPARSTVMVASAGRMSSAVVVSRMLVANVCWLKVTNPVMLPPSTKRKNRLMLRMGMR